ncbi:MAG: hypothetical protein ACRD3I_00410 [Terriglobales bacterium]
MTLKSRRLILLVPLVVVLGLLCCPRRVSAQTKLYMKDGSYQLVKSYEIQGDRVRYYSLERSAWEEVPRALVDFEATERVRREEEAAIKKELEEARAVAAERFERPEESGFEVAPGIRLPGEEGVFAFDGTRVIRMIQSSGEVVTDKKRAALLLALPGPLLKNRAYVVLPGAQAAVRVPSLDPVFYVQASDDLGAKLELMAVKPRKETRQVEKVEWRGGITKPVELRGSVPLERTQIAPGLYRLRPLQPLEPGEYALGELIHKKLNLELWDFGITGAPATATAGDDTPPTIRRSDKPPND